MRPETDLKISESMCFFSCLHVHVSYPICTTCEKKIWIGSLLEPCNVNAALETESCERLKREKKENKKMKKMKHQQW